MNEATKIECQASLLAMRRASRYFYRAAVLCDNHAFVEWTGLMNEYINVCTWALENGQDFRHANKHTGKALTMPGFSADYITEKLDCIFNGAISVKQRKPLAKRAQRIKVMKFRCSGACGKPWTYRVYGDVRQLKGEDESSMKARAEDALNIAVAAKAEERRATPCDLCKGPVVQVA